MIDYIYMGIVIVFVAILLIVGLVMDGDDV